MATSNVSGSGGVDRAITTALGSTKVDRATLSSIVNGIKELTAVGFRPRDVFPLGTPVIDRVGVELHGSASEIEKLIPLLTSGRIAALEVMTKGIPKPDLFVTRVQFKTGGGPVSR